MRQCANVLINFKGEFRTSCSRGVMLRIRGVSCYALEGSFNVLMRQCANVPINFKGEFRTSCSRGVMLRIRGVSCYALEGSF